MIKNNNKDFLNKVAIITGGASGIGFETAKNLYNKGAKIVLIGKSDRVHNTAKYFKKKTHLISLAIDLTNETDVKNMVAATIKKFKKIDILVNSAGVTGPGNIESTTLADWEYIHKSNGTSTFLCCKYVVPHMKKKRYGKIVNVSSIAGRFRGRTSGLHYAYSKSGILGFTRQLAAEIGPWQINVNCFCPSQTMTKMLKELITPKIEKELKRTIPLRRIALPKEQAAVIEFLTSDNSSYIAGAMIDSNGAQF
tara:strand:- start:82 stop:837 length:756 start_codon:yes stop_codon:yes gene_type:complete